MVRDKKGRVLSPGTPLEAEAIPEFTEKLAYVMDFAHATEEKELKQKLDYCLEKGLISFSCEWMERLDELADYLETRILLYL